MKEFFVKDQVYCKEEVGSHIVLKLLEGGRMKTLLVNKGIKEEYCNEKSSVRVLDFTHEEIKTLLPIFNEEHIYMREAKLTNSELECVFDTFKYPFSRLDIKHLTRTHALLFITQACYLMIAVFKEYNSGWPIDRQKAQELALQEKMAFTDIEIRFKKYIKNEDGIQLRLFNPSFRIFGKNIIAQVQFEFPMGCFGKCKGIISCK